MHCVPVSPVGPAGGEERGDSDVGPELHEGAAEDGSGAVRLLWMPNTFGGRCENPRRGYDIRRSEIVPSSHYRIRRSSLKIRVQPTSLSLSPSPYGSLRRTISSERKPLACSM